MCIVQPRTSMMADFFTLPPPPPSRQHTEAQFIVPDWGVKVDFHSIIIIFIAVSQYFWRCFTIFVIAVSNNYWHCFQLYSGPCYCTVLFSTIFQLYSWLCYSTALFPPFPALFPAVLLYSFIPGHVTVQHYSQPF